MGFTGVTAAGASSAAAAGPSAISVPFTFAADPFELRLLPSHQLGFPAPLTVPRKDTGLHDANGARLIRVNGRLYNSPGGQAAYGVANLNTYRLTGDEFYLDRALVQARTMLTDYVRVGEAWFFPHRYPKDVHWKNGAPLRPPWYSAMTQGYALGLFTGLWEETEDPVLRAAADAVFAGFLDPGPGRTAPTVAVDARGRLWLEEWPYPPHDHALNGHIFASWGLYEYYRVWRDPAAQQLFRGAATTVLRSIGKYRRAGWMSRYCLAHNTANARYHAVHVWQLTLLYTMTGEPAFARAADLLLADYPPPVVAGRLAMMPGRHHGFRFSASGRVVAHRIVTLDHAARPGVCRRERIRGRAGIWFRITGGPLRGFWVAEDPARAYLPGRLATLVYRPFRAATLPAGRTFRGFDYGDDGNWSASRSVTAADDLAASVEARATINGVPHLLMSGGQLAGLWVPADGILLDGASQ
jgi:hypothetical protein